MSARDAEPPVPKQAKSLKPGDVIGAGDGEATVRKIEPQFGSDGELVRMHVTLERVSDGQEICGWLGPRQVVS